MQEAVLLAQRMHAEDKSFLAMEYRQNYRKWLRDILYWSDYMQDKIALDAEFPSVQAVSDGTLDVSDWMRDDFNLDLFFKKLRVQILYLGKKDYARMKLRTLMAKYGYQRRSKDFVRFLKIRLIFYHIQTALRGNEICDVEAMDSLDDMITFRVV
ncbi:MAG: hypothetical protein ACFNLO_08715 [Selenomonas massiliensis]